MEPQSLEIISIVVCSCLCDLSSLRQDRQSAAATSAQTLHALQRGLADFMTCDMPQNAMTFKPRFVLLVQASNGCWPVHLLCSVRSWLVTSRCLRMGLKFAFYGSM